MAIYLFIFFFFFKKFYDVDSFKSFLYDENISKKNVYYRAYKVKLGSYEKKIDIVHYIIWCTIVLGLKLKKFVVKLPPSAIRLCALFKILNLCV